jgi:hypothetical protein
MVKLKPLIAEEQNVMTVSLGLREFWTKGAVKHNTGM